MFKSFFKKNNKEDKESKVIEEKTFSLACILVEAALVDEEFGQDEEMVILKILKKQFEIKDDNFVKEIIQKAIDNFKNSSDLVSHTKKIKDNWSLNDRIDVIEMLWRVCLVDGKLEPYEDMLIRRISGLIYVDDKSRNIAKQNALKKVNL